MVLMMTVVMLYTLCSLNDKYAVAKAGYNGSQLTFMMSAGTVLFLSFLLPFADRTFTFSPVSFLCIILIALSKYLEFAMSAKILETMSVFELKAWLGINMFLSYFTDVAVDGVKLSAIKIMLIAVTAAGLVLIAGEGKKQVDYRRIALPLVLYLGARYIYGPVMKYSEGYISSTMTLYFALIVLALVTLPAAKPWKIPEESPEGIKGMLIVGGCKLPNAFGLMGENAVAAQSLTNFSFIAPMILIVIFFKDLFDKNVKTSMLSAAGGIAVIIGIVGFQAALNMG